MYFTCSGWVLAGSLGHDAWIPVNTVDPSDHGTSAHGGQPQGGTYFGGVGGSRGGDGQNPMHEGGQQPTAVRSTTFPTLHILSSLIRHFLLQFPGSGAREGKSSSKIVSCLTW